MGIFDGFFDSLFNNNMTGWVGETYTELELGIGKLFGYKGKMLRNVYIPKDDGTTSEIDVLYITKKGIYVIESKNYSGWIFGDEKSQYWTVSLPNNQKNRFYNPILQNKSHIKWLGNYLKDSTIPLFSIIAFSERCTLKKVPQPDDAAIIKRDEMILGIRKFWDNCPDLLTNERIDELWNVLKTLTNVDSKTKAEHVESIEKNYKTPKESTENKEKEISEDVPHSMQLEESNKASMENKEVDNSVKCPKCGAPLILRTAKKGPNAGNQFYGCSAFPKCKFIQNL